MNESFFPLLALHRGADLLGTSLSLPTGRPDPSRPRRPGWLERIDAWFARQRERSRDAWLAQAQDVHDLERRIRDLERDFGSRYY